jgi:hypothetical protein
VIGRAIRCSRLAEVAENRPLGMMIARRVFMRKGAIMDTQYLIRLPTTMPNCRCLILALPGFQRGLRVPMRKGKGSRGELR